MNILSLLGIRRRIYRQPTDLTSSAGISYAVMACDEALQLDELLKFIEQHLRANDEIVVQTDADKATPEVLNVIESHSAHITATGRIAVNMDFATAKNHLNSLCLKDYIFQLDADELPTENLINNLPDIIAANSDIDLFKIARNNIFDNADGSVSTQTSWPDYQGRLYRRSDGIAWQRPLHEKIRGYERYTYLPADTALCIIHRKNRMQDLNKWADWLGKK